MDTLYTVEFTEVSGLSSFKNVYNHTTGCGDIAYCLVGYFILSHPVHFKSDIWPTLVAFVPMNVTEKVVPCLYNIPYNIRASTSRGKPICFSYVGRYLFTIVSYLIGVFVFATIVGMCCNILFYFYAGCFIKTVPFVFFRISKENEQICTKISVNVAE